MTDPTETQIRRLFAQAPAVGEDESFVAAMGAAIRLRRRRRQRGIAILWVTAAVALAAVLAPFAPTVTVEASLPASLAGLPELTAGNAVQRGSDLWAAASSLPTYWYYVIGSIALPLVLATGLAMIGRRAG
jgi:hypothetical protein